MPKSKVNTSGFKHSCLSHLLGFNIEKLENILTLWLFLVFHAGSGPVAGIIYASRYELDLFFFRNANLRWNKVGINEPTEGEKSCYLWRLRSLQTWHITANKVLNVITRVRSMAFGAQTCHWQCWKCDGGKTTLKDLGLVAQRLHRG